MLPIPEAALQLGVPRKVLDDAIADGSLAQIDANGVNNIDLKSAKLVAELYRLSNKINDISVAAQKIESSYNSFKDTFIRPRAGWTDYFQIILSTLTLAAAGYAVFVASNQLDAAIESYQSSNFYNIQKDMTALVSNDVDPLARIEEQFSVGLLLKEHNSILQSSWASFTDRICKDVKKTVCAQQQGVSGSTLTREKLSSITPSITDVCFANKGEPNICSP